MNLTIPEPARAWAWQALRVTAVAAAVAAFPAAVLVGVIAVLNWGTLPGIAATMALFAVGYTTIAWLGGKWRL